MIPRYTRSEMAAIWSDENRFKVMLEVEILACEAMEKLGGIGGKTYVFNIENLYATDDLPSEVAIAIDRALLKLHQSKNSVFAEAF